MPISRSVLDTNWRIDPTPPHGAEFAGPGAWRRSTFGGPGDWTWEFPAQSLLEMDAALDRIRRRGLELSSLTAADFPLPSFDAVAAPLRQELLQGRGFVLLRGFPTDRYSDEEMIKLYWGLGTHLGSPLPQNVAGERVYSVRDHGYRIERDYGTVGVRFSKTTEGLNFHTDSAPALMGATPGIVGLLALQPARSGGSSRLVSALTLHNLLLAERPDYLARLYHPFHFDRRAELRPGEPQTLAAPIFTYHGDLAIRYFRFYIPIGHELAGVPLDPEDLAAMDYLESIAAREELQVDFDMRRGEIQLVSNTRVLHSRTPFQDHAEKERKRHLIRLWLAA
jgi:alpha-ketoglutarate-dependent taurine dioxygenase